jgi:hypothetical protein
MYTATRTSLSCPDRELGYWAILVVVFGLFNALACLGNMPFASPNGLQFWVLMGVLFEADALAREADRRARSVPAAARPRTSPWAAP